MSARTMFIAFFVTTMVLASTWSLSAHHPIAPEYFEDRTETITGDLVRLELRNPHSIVYVDTSDAAGQTTRWTIEWLAIFQLSRQGVTAGTLRVGDHLVITGLPGRRPDDHRLLLRTITRPRDHWKWSGVFG